MLIVELDGSQHAAVAQSAVDEGRTRELAELGYDVIRFWNLDVNQNMTGVLGSIVSVATLRLSPSSSPSGHILPREKEKVGCMTLSSPGTAEEARRAG